MSARGNALHSVFPQLSFFLFYWNISSHRSFSSAPWWECSLMQLIFDYCERNDLSNISATCNSFKTVCSFPSICCSLFSIFFLPVSYPASCFLQFPSFSAIPFVFRTTLVDLVCLFRGFKHWPRYFSPMERNILEQKLDFMDRKSFTDTADKWIRSDVTARFQIPGFKCQQCSEQLVKW